MALSRTEIQKRSDEKRGIVQKKFNLDPETLALLNELTALTGKNQTQVFREALAALKEKL